MSVSAVAQPPQWRADRCKLFHGTVCFLTHLAQSNRGSVCFAVQSDYHAKRWPLISKRISASMVHIILSLIQHCQQIPKMSQQYTNYLYDHPTGDKEVGGEGTNKLAVD